MKQEKEKIPKGFKSSEVGIIPADWDLLEVKDVFEYINTTSFSRENLTYDKTESQVYYIHYGDIHATFKFELLDFDVENELPFLKDEYVAANFTFLKDGDLVMADASEDYEGVGKSIELKNIRTKKVISGLHTFALRDNSRKTVRGYRTYMFNNFNVSIALRKIATGSSVYGISKGNLSKLKLPIPPSTEQTSIANCLSTWDKAIEKTEALLAQKEKRKKWLMRMLLTGKKRLKGFEKEKWLKGKFSDFVDLLHGHQFRKEDFVPAGIPVIKIGNVIGYELDLTDLTYVAESRENEFSDVLLKNGDLLMSLTGNIGRVIEIRNFRGKAFQNYRVGKFVSYDEKVLSREYLKFLLGSESLLNQFLNMANQSAQANFGKQDMNKLNVTFSKSLEEQNAIASFLEHIEGEVKLLQLKLGEIKKQKQGLMQVLLTGKKRLKIKK